ncbi:MAG: type V CRISPR-associated protein Cas4 [Solobacterium sp.]|nr:type V CRISPR-associated protein Cas4 [Solobacterium sp.]
MKDILTITTLNDYIFCPISIYYHNILNDLATESYYSDSQVKGKNAHQSIDQKTYSTSNNVLQGIDVYSDKYHITGKIDLYYKDTKTLSERKKKIVTIYDGYVFQLYGQYFGMIEQGYEVEKLQFHSIDDNKTYNLKLPEEDPDMKKKFEQVIWDINHFNVNSYHPVNENKCRNCIYTYICAESLYDE